MERGGGQCAYIRVNKGEKSPGEVRGAQGDVQPGKDLGPLSKRKTIGSF